MKTLVTIGLLGAGLYVLSELGSTEKTTPRSIRLPWKSTTGINGVVKWAQPHVQGFTHLSFEVRKRRPDEKGGPLRATVFDKNANKTLFSEPAGSFDQGKALLQKTFDSMLGVL